MPLSRHSVGTYPEISLHATCQGRFLPQSFQLDEPPWAGPGIKSEISVRELISTLKKKKIARRKLVVEHSPEILSSENRATQGRHHYSRLSTIRKRSISVFFTATRKCCVLWKNAVKNVAYLFSF